MAHHLFTLQTELASLSIFGHINQTCVFGLLFVSSVQMRSLLLLLHLRLFAEKKQHSAMSAGMNLCF